MATLPVIDDVFRCTLNWTSNDGHSAHNVMHFLAASASPGDVFDRIAESIDYHMWEIVSDECGITSVDILPLDGTSATFHMDTDGSQDWNGFSTGSYIPQVAGVVRLPTGQRGPAHRGRVFVPFVAELQITNGYVDPLAFTDWEEAWQSFVANAGVNGIQMVVASYLNATAAAVGRPTCRRALGTLRRRNKQFVNV